MSIIPPVLYFAPCIILPNRGIASPPSPPPPKILILGGSHNVGSPE